LGGNFLDNTMAKLFVEMIAYNSGPIIEAAIRSTAPFAEKIIVVDGSPLGPSTDGTAELARSCGSNVQVVQGTFVNTPECNDGHPTGTWNEGAQRQVCEDIVPKDFNNWIMIQDSDEVFDSAGIEELMRQLQAMPDSILTYALCVKHFMNDLHHFTWGESIGGLYRPFGIFRHTYPHTPVPAVLVPMPNVFFYHYGHILSRERTHFKVHQYLERGDYLPKYGPKDWEKFYAENWYQYDIAALTLPGVQPFIGQHPEEIRRLSMKIWGEQL
jgi:glycosyltransferase involved in cell wall biosynthesis